MNWSLPTDVCIDGAEYNIRNNCDYRVVLDVIAALNDEDLEPQHRIACALFIFYESLEGCEDTEKAVKEMYRIINNGEDADKNKDQYAPKLMDWEYDFNLIAPPVSRVLGYSVRDSKNYTHWYDFIGAYGEIGGECTFSTITSIRAKKAKGKKLDKWEEEYCREHPDLVYLPRKMSDEEREFLFSET